MRKSKLLGYRTVHNSALTAAIALLGGGLGSAFAANPSTRPSETFSLGSLGSLSKLGPIVANSSTAHSESASSASSVPGGSLSVLPLFAPPINGYQPFVAFGLTDEQDKDDFNFNSKVRSAPGGNTLPVGRSPYYDIGVFDTGSQSHLITYQDSLGFDIDGANRSGDSEAQIEGTSGIETVDVTDALGVYMTALNNATVTVGTNNVGLVKVNTSTLRGQSNTSILTTREDSTLPNIVGAPMAAQYQSLIKPSQTRHVTVNGTTYRGPSVSTQAQGTALPAGYSKLTLGVQSVNGTSNDPVFFPSIEDINNVADNPATPTFWGSFIASVNASHTGGTATGQGFLFDTGAQVSVVSEDTAASVGFYTGGENPTTPDFYVAVSGVGGTTDQVPGFYMNSLSITTNGGPITWTHVPVLVLDIPDPTDGVGFIPGVLGMNLFTDRDIIINGGTANPFLGIGPQITPQWTGTGGGVWSDDTKWSLGSPDNADTPANFLSTITAPSTVTVDAQGFTVGSMKFDSAISYTIAGPGTITFAALSTGTSSISVVTGSHTISAPVALQSNTLVTVAPSTSTLTMSNDVNGGTYTITKAGAGTLAMKNVRAGSLAINQGTVSILTNGSSASASRVGSLAIALSGGNPTATLDLRDNDLQITGGMGKTAVEALVRYAYDNRTWDRNGISSSAARGNALHVTTLGVLSGQQFLSTGASSFDGSVVQSGDVLVKYTYFGDADFNGKINADDYAHIDGGYQNQHNGGFVFDWFDGDFDYNGKINADDYALIDVAYQLQSGTLRAALDYLAAGSTSEPGNPSLAQVISHEQQFGDAYVNAFVSVAVPEPTSMAMMFGVFGAVSKRRRHR